MSQHNTIGILAYGSLIDDPGTELLPKIRKTIDCVTPFNIEYARMSKSRGNAPTLIPVKENGSPVKAKILVLENVTETEAADMLWRRETRQKDLSKPYPRKEHPSTNDVTIKVVDDFQGIQKVLYASIGQNLGILTAPVLAKLAIDSFYTGAGDDNKDGIHYLMNAKSNGIETPLTSSYEKSILEATNSTSLLEAILSLSKKKPAYLKQKKDHDQFERKYKEIGDLVHYYGLKKTLNGKEITGEQFRDFIKENNQAFIVNVHEGFKKGQELILELLLEYEDKRKKLEDEKKELKGKAFVNERKIIDEKIAILEYRDDLLRHMIDSIAWQLIQGQLYIARRLFQGVGGKKRLRDTNIESVICVARDFNKKPEDFALITDLSGYIQIGDILLRSGSTFRLVEVKQGEKSSRILKYLDDILTTDKTPKEIFKDAKIDRHFIQQMDRTLKQFQTAHDVLAIIQNDKGKDKEGNDVTIITPKEDTPRFDDRMHALEEQLKKRNFWGYDVIEDCLHIGLYKGPLRYLGPQLLKGLGEQSGSKFMIIDYRRVVKSLNRPIFTLPFSSELIYDILFGRVYLLMMLEIDTFLQMFEAFGMQARWMTKKETGRLRTSKKGLEIFMYNGQGVEISGIGDDDKNHSMYLSPGLFYRIVYEYILPSYVAYSCHYYLKMEDSLNKEG